MNNGESEAMLNSFRKPKEEGEGFVININLNDALSYGSMVEIKDVLSKSEEDKALIACALKSRKILIIMLLPA